jgi:hypothetical protein
MSTATIPTVWNGHDFMQHTYSELSVMLSAARDEAILQQHRLFQRNPDNITAYNALPYRKPDVIHAAMIAKIKAGEFAY